ncbi:hypothetical protein H4R19_004711 [Coemansia spiralis]|nr:hypothetical protein H4R19_004711 [Coemansia spiralis]
MAGMGGMSNNMGGMSGMGNNMGGMGSMGNMGTMGGVNTGAGAATFDPFGLSNTPAAGSNMGSAMGLVSGMNSMNMGSGVGAGLSAPLGFSTPLATNTPGAYDNSGFGGASSNQYMAKSSMTASVTESSLGGANPFGLGATQQQQQQPSPMANTGGFGGAAGMFGSAFDGGAGAKALPYAGVNDANARLAEIARNSDKIDPFASLAMQSSSNPFGASSATSSAMQSQGLEASSALTSMVNTPANFTTGGSSLLDFGGISQTSSAIMPSPQSFGQVNRNPFAAGGSGMALGQSSMQPSLNQLMAGGGGSGAGSSNQLSMSTSNNLFDQQQNNSSTGAFSNVHAESQNMSFQQQQQQQGGGMGGFSNIQAESQNKSFQQSQGAGAGGAFSSLQAESQQSSYQQSQGFGQPQGLGQLQGFGQSQGLGQSQGFGQPQGLGQMQGFGQQSQPQQQQQNPFAQDSFAGSSQPNFFGL